MVAANLGKLLSAQVERSNAGKAVVVQFAATVPGDGSQVSVDWWLRQINETLRGGNVPISMEFADLDKPSQLVGAGESSPIKVTQLKRQINEMQLLIDDLESHIKEKAAALAEEIMSNSVGHIEGLSKAESALRAVEQDGYYVDSKGSRWLDIASEAKRIGKSYITVWRACKAIGNNKAEAWVVGETQAGGERILIKQGSFSQGKRKKAAKK